MLHLTHLELKGASGLGSRITRRLSRCDEKRMNDKPEAATRDQPIVRHVVHRLDPLRRAVPVVGRFMWLGNFKLVVRKGDGTFQKDWEYEYDDAASDELPPQ